uniref:Putative secreted protein n=1 Tax=Anopheles marajoara TaxID=58244 RepID=A0A2M4C6B2_9DIPT
MMLLLMMMMTMIATTLQSTNQTQSEKSRIYPPSLPGWVGWRWRSTFWIPRFVCVCVCVSCRWFLDRLRDAVAGPGGTGILRRTAIDAIDRSRSNRTDLRRPPTQTEISQNINKHRKGPRSLAGGIPVHGPRCKQIIKHGSPHPSSDSPEG